MTWGALHLGRKAGARWESGGRKLTVAEGRPSRAKGRPLTIRSAPKLSRDPEEWSFLTYGRLIQAPEARESGVRVDELGRTQEDRRAWALFCRGF